MAQFRDFLKEEGLQPNAGRVEIIIPMEKRLGSRLLKTIGLKKLIQGVSTESGDAFRKLGPVSTLEPPPPDDDLVADYLHRNPVVLNWYPLAGPSWDEAKDKLSEIHAEQEARYLATHGFQVADDVVEESVPPAPSAA